MIDYIKDYGISKDNYEMIVNKLTIDEKETLILNRSNIEEVLNYYNQLGINAALTNIFLYRFDLINIPLNVLENMLNNIDIKLFKLMINNNIKDLMVLGI